MTRTAKLVGVIIVIIVLGIAFFMWKPATAPTSSLVNPPASTTSSTTNGGTTGPIEPPTGSTSYSYGTVKLSVGQTAIFSDISLSPSSVEDSRCATGHECIQAGTAKVFFVVISNSGTTNQSLSIGQQVTVDGVKIVLQSVDPYPLASKTTAQNNYVMTFSVTKPSAPPVATAQCFVGGCSNEICSDDPHAVSSCVYRAEYACYKSATCERQPSGQCGWTQTPALVACLSNPLPAQ